MVTASRFLLFTELGMKSIKLKFETIYSIIFLCIVLYVRYVRKSEFWHDVLYLNHLSSFELLNMAELAGVADQFSTLQIDNALQGRGGNNIYHESPKTSMDPKEIEQNPHIHIIIITGTNI